MVRGVAELRCRAVPRAANVDQVRGIERSSAGVALIAAGAGVLAIRAGALDEPIREEPLLGNRVRHRLVRLVQKPPFVEPHENVVGDLVMVIGVGVRVHIVREAHCGKAFRPDLVVSLCDDFRFDAFVRRP